MIIYNYKTNNQIPVKLIVEITPIKCIVFYMGKVHMLSYEN